MANPISGHDTNIPSRDFVPPIELDDVENYFQRNTAILTGTLELAFGKGPIENQANGVLLRFMDGVFQQCRESLPTSENTPVNTRRPKLPLARSAPQALRQNDSCSFQQLRPGVHDIRVTAQSAIPTRTRQNVSEHTFPVDTMPSNFQQGANTSAGSLPFFGKSFPI